MTANAQVFVKAAVAIALTLAALLAVGSNAELREGISTAADAGAEFMLKVRTAISTSLSDIAAKIRLGIFGGASSGTESQAQFASQGFLTLNLDGGETTSARAEAEARTQGEVQFDLAHRLQMVVDTLGIHFQSFFRLDF